MSCSNNKLKFTEIKCSGVRCFQLCDEPEVIYVIKIDDNYMNKGKRYILVHEDAYEINTGKSEILFENEILEKYNIKL